MSDVNYFFAYRYQEGGYTIDGNTVITLDRAVTTEDDIRSIEAMIAKDKGVGPESLGLLNIVRLDT